MVVSVEPEQYDMAIPLAVAHRRCGNGKSKVGTGGNRDPGRIGNERLRRLDNNAVDPDPPNPLVGHKRTVRRNGEALIAVRKKKSVICGSPLRLLKMEWAYQNVI